MSPLLLLFVGLAAAVTPENIRIIQHQSAVVAEASLQQTMSRCMLNHFCAVGVAEGRDISPNSIASALFDSYNIVNIVLDSKNTYAADLQNMQKIKSAFELGQVSRKAELCNQVFECTNRDVDIAMPDLARSERVDCSGLGQVCPGLSIGCSLCGMFFPGACGAICPMAGLFCGGSGYLCTLASGTNPPDLTTPIPARAEVIAEAVVAVEEPAEMPRSLNPKMKTHTMA